MTLVCVTQVMLNNLPGGYLTQTPGSSRGLHSVVEYDCLAEMVGNRQ